MDHISLYLKKFLNYGGKDIQTKKDIIEVVKNTTGIVLGIKKITLNENNIRIDISGSEKALIFIKKEEIQKELLRLGEKRKV